MEITVEMLNKELTALAAQKTQLEDNFKALNGATAMAEYLLNKLKAEEVPNPAPEVGADSTIHTEVDVDVDPS